ncbi:hypothetical protein [Serratia bockelmannii]|uniref:hypothetical protein n=1 Tax=Serratia bockelmannii TaxID=2703793 RepID=UPI003F6D12E5
MPKPPAVAVRRSASEFACQNINPLALGRRVFLCLPLPFHEDHFRTVLLRRWVADDLRLHRRVAAFGLGDGGFEAHGALRFNGQGNADLAADGIGIRGATQQGATAGKQNFFIIAGIVIRKPSCDDLSAKS